MIYRSHCDGYLCDALGIIIYRSIGYDILSVAARSIVTWLSPVSRSDSVFLVDHNINQVHGNKRVGYCMAKANAPRLWALSVLAAIRVPPRPRPHEFEGLDVCLSVIPFSTAGR